MALVVFMRAVNVGKHQRFSVSALAKEMSALDVVNIGAVGTLVVKRRITPTALREELWKRMPFKAELMICDGRALLSVAEAESKPPAAVDGIEVQRFLTALAGAPKQVPTLPLFDRIGNDWQTKIVRIEGCLAVSYWRRMGKRDIYPNEVLEKTFKLSSTTRNWNTALKIADVLSR